MAIGSSEHNDLVLTDQTVSAFHLELKNNEGGLEVRDLGSTNGTRSGRISLKNATLERGAELDLGHTRIRIDEGDPLTIDALEDDEFYGLYARSESMRRLMARAARIARANAAVIVLGETGVGKEVLARALHRASDRSDQSFEAVDCGALAPQLVSSELFGHEKGAFTGADRQHVGAFERADGGTLFLDEIGELPPTLQTWLLGALERRSFRRVGGDRPISVDVRLICATHRDLREEVNAGRFRADLYYRIAVVRLEIPPLRERPEDVPFLVEHFLGESGNDDVEALVPAEVMDELMGHRWPGNVRELRNFVEATLAMGEAADIQPSRGPSPTLGMISGLLELEFSEARKSIVSHFEKTYLSALFERAGGNVSKASRMSGVHRTYLDRMLKRHGLK